MRIIVKDYRKTVKVVPESLDDLWHLAHVLREGDTVAGRTVRTLQNVDEKEKKKVFVKLMVDRVEFSEEGGSLRIGGVITEGPDEVSRGHHTLLVRPGDVLSIEKEWLSHEKKRLETAARQKMKPVLIAVMDERAADFAIAREKGVKMSGRVTGESVKLSGEEARSRYYEKILKALESYKEKVGNIIIAGPGFTKDNIAKILRPEVKGKCLVEGASVTGRTGVNEVIKRGAIDRIVRQSIVSEHSRLMEKLLEAISREKPSAYGIDEVKRSAEAGAVEDLLVSDKRVRNREVQGIMELVEKKGGSMHVLSAEHESGEKLEGLGGIAAILRFDVK